MIDKITHFCCTACGNAPEECECVEREKNIKEEKRKIIGIKESQGKKIQPYILKITK